MACLCCVRVGTLSLHQNFTAPCALGPSPPYASSWCSSDALAMPVSASRQVPHSASAAPALGYRGETVCPRSLSKILSADPFNNSRTIKAGLSNCKTSSIALLNTRVLDLQRTHCSYRLGFRKRRTHGLPGSRKNYSHLRWRGRDLKRGVLFNQMENLEENSQSVVMSHVPGTDSASSASFMDRLKKHPLSGLFDGISNSFRADELGKEIAVIALPALLALAADPLASLVDTAFIGQIGPVDLAAVGVSISIFNLVSKMFNLPLLNITTSFVAEDEASAKDGTLEPPTEESPFRSTGTEEEMELLQPHELYIPKSTKPLLPAVSSALVLGTALGVMEATVLTVGAGPILSMMGVGAGSSMRTPALQYLALRAIGAPAVVVALAVQGVFRGFKDTRTPLIATVLGNVVNIILCPILMFSFKFGVGGAAVATVISQYLMALILLWTLNSRVMLLPPKLGDLRFDRFLKSGTLLLTRTLAILLTMTLATSMAARLGPIPMAAHQICMQVWLAASLLSDSLALAGQAIIASAFAKEDYRRVKQASFRILQMGLGFGVFMALLLGVGSGWFTKLFTNDVGVLEIMSFILPFVILTQPINSLAFVFDGIYYGVSDFSFAAYSMVVVAIPSSIFLLCLPPMWGIVGVWTGLTVLMILRMSAGFFRISTSTGPWNAINKDYEERLMGNDIEDNITTL
ncbi:MATE family, citrate exporter [Marchantia polymorpha subsp. ruderalis]|uniref:Protein DETOXIFICATION n=4 Tax=Marchantia polymorpha TaxID=3197 RepID=A0AAF6BSA1_MARPO|nr:hypothetical protein MARPO_0056s0043 [Marchantia polymorpha]BBN14885.1 hypothetical protein Mp_6g15320 [Marchantia polymorpha subsp. ruderalis]|eukprot:PTQ37570.1 hypothetical protein MARPO_0056s0043 [Marchantia polymorpha]